MLDVFHAVVIFRQICPKDLISAILDLKLENFRLEKNLKISFQLDDEQFKIVQDNIDVYGHSRIGKSKTLKMLPNQKLWRRPLVTSNHTTYLCWDDE